MKFKFSDKKQGFNLIELIVVIAIVATLVTAATLQYRQYRGNAQKLKTEITPISLKKELCCQLLAILNGLMIVTSLLV